MFHKKYNMDMNTANETLQNVFKACNQTPNTIPFDKLVLKGIARTALVTTCKWIAIGFLLLTLIAPLAFQGSGFTVSSKGFGEQIVITNHTLYEDSFEFIITGNNIDYENIYAKKEDGTLVFPSSVESVDNTLIVTIPYDGVSLNIYIPSRDGTVLQAILSERNH